MVRINSKGFEQKRYDCGKDWINKDLNIEDLMNMACIGKVCIVLERIGLENIGQDCIGMGMIVS